MARKTRVEGVAHEGSPAKTRKLAASLKFDMLDALLLDDSVKPADFKVAYALIQHMNSLTGACFPSIETLAAETNLTERYVQQCISNLRAVGWLSSTRSNRQLSNSYEFNFCFAEAILPRRRAIVRDRKAGRWSRRDANGSSGRATSPTGTIAPPATGTPDLPNTVMKIRKKAAG